MSLAKLLRVNDLIEAEHFMLQYDQFRLHGERIDVETLYFCEKRPCIGHQIQGRFSV